MVYLTKADYRNIHAILSKWAEKDGEPLPSFSLARKDELDSLINAPKQTFGGQELYPSLEEKAAFIFYRICKGQIFANGNKRMSTASLIIFLFINNKELKIAPDQLTRKALWLANTKAEDFQSIKTTLTSWISENIIAIP